MRTRGFLGAISLAVVVAIAAAVASRSGLLSHSRTTSTGTIAVRVNPGVVCLDPGAVPYLNFDFVVTNATDQKVTLGEMRASVFDQAGDLTERRVVASDAVALVQPDRTLPPHADGLIFNPLHFASAT